MSVSAVQSRSALSCSYRNRYLRAEAISGPSVLRPPCGERASGKSCCSLRNTRRLHDRSISFCAYRLSTGVRRCSTKNADIAGREVFLESSRTAVRSIYTGKGSGGKKPELVLTGSCPGWSYITLPASYRARICFCSSENTAN